MSIWYGTWRKGLQESVNFHILSAHIKLYTLLSAHLKSPLIPICHKEILFSSIWLHAPQVSECLWPIYSTEATKCLGFMQRVTPKSHLSVGIKLVIYPAIFLFKGLEWYCLAIHILEWKQKSKCLILFQVASLDNVTGSQRHQRHVKFSYRHRLMFMVFVALCFIWSRVNRCL